MVLRRFADLGERCFLVGCAVGRAQFAIATWYTAIHVAGEKHYNHFWKTKATITLRWRRGGTPIVTSCYTAAVEPIFGTCIAILS